MTVGIVGLGLIGGSMAKAFRENTDHQVLGFDANTAVDGFAQLSGIVHGELTETTIPSCDLLILATYPAAAKEYLVKIAPNLSHNAIVIDCLGTKERICELGFALAREHGFIFVGGHPMAGSERSGIKFARADLFEGASMVLVPPDGNDILLLQRLKELLNPLGFARITVTTAQEHDRRIGFTSQLPHLISNAMVQSPSAMLHSGFSAGSFRDLTRVAELNSRMWAELFLENQENLIEELDVLLSSLGQYRAALAQRDSEGLQSLLEAGSRRKKEISKQ
ncbi:MAG: prephenate dehydrogenase [Ruminococcaceae bacterium]|nr:prephenate dehydrogenase [Oscillospiraceae bacterium]